MRDLVKMLVLCILILAGCSNDKNETLKEVEIAPAASQEIQTVTTAAPSNLPEEVTLSFTAIDFLPTVSERNFIIPDKWTYKESVSFGKESNEELQLSIYQDVSDLSSLPSTFHGVLNVQDKDYIIFNLSPSIINDGVVDHSLIQTYQQSISPDASYILIASIDVGQNGPGLKCYIVYNTITQEYSFFEAWGDLIFYDLDLDGVDECVIEFKGLHLSMPDLSIVQVNDETLEICSSLLTSFNTGQGSSVTLEKVNTQPFINVNTFINSENIVIHYIYDHGVLYRNKL